MIRAPNDRAKPQASNDIGAARDLTRNGCALGNSSGMLLHVTGRPMIIHSDGCKVYGEVVRSAGNRNPDQRMVWLALGEVTELRCKDVGKECEGITIWRAVVHRDGECIIDTPK